jgi:hypothetical protein
VNVARNQEEPQPVLIYGTRNPMPDLPEAQLQLDSLLDCSHQR